MAREREALTRIFTYEEAVALFPEVHRLTEEAVAEVELLSDRDEADEDVRQTIGRWAETLIVMGIQVKGLWLIDFDSGSGYYCWKWPEPALQFFHGYDEGFGGRVRLN
jgi:hypothetical protein